MKLKKLLGKRIQELRIKNGLKQSELAEKVGIATKHQSCIETGKNYQIFTQCSKPQVKKKFLLLIKF